MKNLKLILLSLMAVAASSLRAQSEADTLAVVQNPGCVVVTVSDGHAKVEVQGTPENKYYYGYDVQTAEDTLGTSAVSKWNLDFPFSGKSGINRSSVRILKSLYAGGLLPVSSADAVKAGWEIGIGEVVGYGWQPSSRGPELSVGIGFGYSELHLSGDMRFAKQGQRLAIVPGGENERDASSGFRMWSLKFPLMLTQTLVPGKGGDPGFGFSLGVVLNLNLKATAYTQAWQEEVRYKQTFDGLHKRMFTADVMASVGMLDAFGVYVKYSPMRLFSKEYGPDMSTLSVGGIINF